MKKYKDYIIIITILFLIFISITVLSNLNKSDKKIINEITYQIETNYSNFFTVNSCITKYVEYLSKKDTDSLLEVIDKNYINSNNINKTNLYNYVDDISGIYSFTSKKMYKSDNEKIIKYYVFGYLKEENIDGIVGVEDKYFILNLDEDNLTFSIIPSNKSEFSEVENG